MTSVRSGVRKVAYLKRSPANTLSRASREPVSARDSIASGPRIGGRQANKSAPGGRRDYSPPGSPSQQIDSSSPDRSASLRLVCGERPVLRRKGVEDSRCRVRLVFSAALCEDIMSLRTAADPDGLTCESPITAMNRALRGRRHPPSPLRASANELLKWRSTELLTAKVAQEFLDAWRRRVATTSCTGASREVWSLFRSTPVGLVRPSPRQRQ